MPPTRSSSSGGSIRAREARAAATGGSIRAREARAAAAAAAAGAAGGSIRAREATYAGSARRSRRGDSTVARSRFRWDRKLRTVMLCVLALIGWLGLKAMLALITTHSQAQQERALVQTLRRQNEALLAQQRSLSQRATIIRDARALGMVRSGEKSYVVTGLPAGR